MKKTDFFVGVPYSKCQYISDVPATREDEAIAIAAGAWLTGKRPTVFMQNSGLGHCVDILTSFTTPYKIDLQYHIEYRDKPEHHKMMGQIQERLCQLLQLKAL